MTGPIAPTPVPRRWQRKREIGAEIPANAIYVGRPTKWGNPFHMDSAIENGFAQTKKDARILVVECFEDWLYRGDLSYWWFENSRQQHEWMRAHLDELWGKDLVCWCSTSPWVPCHADILLAASNQMTVQEVVDEGIRRAEREASQGRG